MKRGKLFTLVGSICLILVLAALPFMAACAAPAPGEPIVLRWVAMEPYNYASNTGPIHFMEVVNERAKGELIIEWAGGPETMSPFEQGRAVADGVIEMAHAPMGYYASLNPVFSATLYSNQDIFEQREQAYDFLLEEHKKVGLYYLGRTDYGHGFAFFLNTKIDKPQELAGLRFRSAFIFDPLMKVFGIDAISMEMGDIYTAMERGLIAGYVTASAGIISLSLHEVTKYWIDQEVWSSGLGLILNLDTWNGLPKHLQDLLMECIIENEKWSEVNFPRPDYAAWRAAGMESIKFSAGDAKWFEDTALEAGWADYTKKHPELAPKCKEVLAKK